MTNFIKKYWFVLLCSIFFLVFLGAYISNNQQDVVKAKQVDGKDLVFSIADKNYTADELYEVLAPSMENPLAIMKFERLVMEAAYEFTEDQRTDAKLTAQQFIQGNRAQYGQEIADKELTKIAKAMGYESIDQFEEYFLNVAAQQKMMMDHIKENMATTYDVWATKFKPRLISHILVKTADPKNPTQQEKDKMTQITEALKTKDFSVVATEFSDDSSASNGGFLGEITTTESQFVEPFLKAALALESGATTSDWVETEYGFHMIRNDGSTSEDIMKQTDFLSKYTTANPTFRGELMLQLAQKANVDYSKNPEFETIIKQQYGLIKGEQK